MAARDRDPPPDGRGPALRDFVAFQLKLLLDGAKDVAAFKLSIVAIVVDLIAGRRREPKAFYWVVRASHRFERWLGLHRVKGMRRLPPSERGAGAGVPDADDLIESAEELLGRLDFKTRRDR